jgi:hypothetical protein
MKHTLYTFIFLMVVAPLSYSQTDSSRNALQFNIVNKTSLAYRYKLSVNSELRASLDFSGGIFDRRRNDVPVYDYGTDSLLFKFDEVNSSNSESIRLSVEYLYSFYRHKQVSLYCSAGPFISNTRDENQYTSKYSQYSQEIDNSHYIRFAWALGAIFSAGVECCVYEYVSILGEYSAILSYGYEGVRPSSAPDLRIISFSFEQLHIGVCIHF